MTCNFILYVVHVWSVFIDACREQVQGSTQLTFSFLDTATHRIRLLNQNVFLPVLFSSFRRAGWAGRGRGWWLVKLLPLQGKMRSPLHFTAKRRKRKLILAKSSSTSPSAFAYSAWSGFFMPSTCVPAWPNGWWPCTRPLLSWMPIAAVPRFPRRGSGAHTGLRSTLAWKPGVPIPLWQVGWHVQGHKLSTFVVEQLKGKSKPKYPFHEILYRSDSIGD